MVFLHLGFGLGVCFFRGLRYGFILTPAQEDGCRSGLPFFFFVGGQQGLHFLPASVDGGEDVIEADCRLGGVGLNHDVSRAFL